MIPQSEIENSPAPSPQSLPRALHTKGNTSDGNLQKVKYIRLPVGCAAPFLEKAGLKEVERVDVRITQADGFLEHGLAFEQVIRA
jgi:hypothetical protein